MTFFVLPNMIDLSPPTPLPTYTHTETRMLIRASRNLLGSVGVQWELHKMDPHLEQSGN